MSSLLKIKLIPSRQLGAVFAGLALMALYSVWLLPFPRVISVAVCLPLLALFTFSWYRYVALKSNCSVTGLSWQAKEKRLSICLRSGEWLNVTAIEHRVVWSWLAAMQVRVDTPVNRTLNLIILSDSLHLFAHYRQFRVFCRFARIKSSSLLADE